MIMKKMSLFFKCLLVIAIIAACEKEKDKGIPSDKIRIDSLTATFDTVKAWDTTTITCYAFGDSLEYAWECDHGNFNGSGTHIKYAAGQCCIGTNTIICTISNNTGFASKEIQIVVTSYYDGGK
jgi:hypothetical protein